MTWGDLSWNERPTEYRPTNRRSVEVVCCPTCKSLHVRRHSVNGPVSYWQCEANPNCPRWKESATTGDEGRAILA